MLAEADAPILWPPDAKRWLTGEDPDAGKDWGQEEEGTVEDEKVGWHHQLNVHKYEQTLGGSEGQGSLACAVCGLQSQTQLSDWTTTQVFLEKFKSIKENAGQYLLCFQQSSSHSLSYRLYYSILQKARACLQKENIRAPHESRQDWKDGASFSFFQLESSTLLNHGISQMLNVTSSRMPLEKTKFSFILPKSIEKFLNKHTNPDLTFGHKETRINIYSMLLNCPPLVMP